MIVGRPMIAFVVRLCTMSFGTSSQRRKTGSKKESVGKSPRRRFVSDHDYFISSMFTDLNQSSEMGGRVPFRFARRRENHERKGRRTRPRSELYR